MRTPLWIVVLALSAASVPAPENPAAPTPTALPDAVGHLAEDLPIGPEDLLEISVFEFPELNLKVRVSEEGSIFLPLLGEISAAGLTVEQLQERLRLELIRDYLKDPQVSVFVREHSSTRVSVLGTVGKPGIYELLGNRTLLQVLSQAGGLEEEAGEQLFVMRQTPDGATQRIVVNLHDLLVNHNPAVNLTIEPGDIISIPRDTMIHIYVDGAVREPGRLEERASRPITLLQAIAQAGGPTERANLKAVKILRQQADGMQTIIKVNLKQIRKGKEPNPLLLDGDVIVVPETFF